MSTTTLGIYLGRYPKSGGGMRVYSLALADEIIQLLDCSTGRLASLANVTKCDIYLAQLSKIVFWADEHCCQILRETLFLKQWISQPNELARKYYPRSDIYKKNGRQLAVVIYPLSNICGRKFGYLLDQVLVGYTANVESVSFIHCTANTGILATRRPQIVTVHDLYQAFIPRRHQVLPDSLREKLRSRIFTAYYRCLFALQFSKIQHVIVDSTHVARQILSLYRYPAEKISVIPLGVERLVTDLQRNEDTTDKDVNNILHIHLDSKGELPSTQSSSDAHLSPTPYILLLGSRDPRKNFQRQLLAMHKWLASIATRPHIQTQAPHTTPHIVICLPDDQTRQIAQQFILENNISPTHVTLLAAVSKPDLLVLMANASLLLNATLAEGFGLPVMESLSFGTPVITGRLDYLKHWKEPWERGLVYTCNTLSVTSIADAVTRCYEEHTHHMLDHNKTQLAKTPIKSVPTMQQVTQETIRVYSTVSSTSHQLKM